MDMFSKTIAAVYIFACVLLGLSGCGGGGGGSSESGGGTAGDNPVTISGIATDDPIVGGTVTATAIDGTELNTATTDTDGRFSLMVDEADIQLGYELTVSGGYSGGEPFAGTLRAQYAAMDSTTNANVTLVTTLVHAMSQQLAGATPVDKRDAAIGRLVSMGMLQGGQWANMEPAGVDLATLRALVQREGLASWLNDMVSDLQDDDLSAEMMEGFPEAHGGIVALTLGDKNQSLAFQGAQLREKIEVVSISEADGSYEFELLSGPEGMSVDGNGTLRYDTPSQGLEGELLFSVQVTNTVAGNGRIYHSAIYLMPTEVVASGALGPEGGQIADEWEDVVLVVPSGMLAESTDLEILRGTQENGRYAYTIRSSTSLTQPVRLYLRDPLVQEGELDVSGGRSQVAVTKGQRPKKLFASEVFDTGNKWTGWRGWVAYVLEIGLSTNRVRKDLLDADGFLPALSSSSASVKYDAAVVSELRSLCGPQETFESQCAGREPILFVHGYTSGVRQPSDLPPLGGGEATWGRFPELLLEDGYAVFEFSWVTAARFRDAAADLADAIAVIQKATGKEVHLIAHSFGGLLARTYLQDLATKRSYQENVADLVTIGTPHSGIFAEAGEYHGVAFPDGQDSLLFKLCRQISCNQAGKPTPSAYTTATDVDLSSVFGVTKEPGGLVASLASITGSEKSLLVPVKALIGLTAYWGRYETGDGLITYEGQRFHPEFSCQEGDNCTDIPTQAGERPEYDSTVEEEVLGFPHGAVPDGELPGIVFAPKLGYRHTKTAAYSGLRGLFGEAYVEDREHAAYKAVTEWLTRHRSEDRTAASFTVTLEIVDAATKVPIPGATVLLGASSTMDESVTNANGVLSVEAAFFPFVPYTAYVNAPGYHAEQFPVVFTGDSADSLPPVIQKRILLEPDEPGRGDLGGQVTNSATGSPISGVDYGLFKNDRPVASGTTDADGRYLIAGLMRGTYELRLNAPAYDDAAFRINVQPAQLNVHDISITGPELVVDTGFNPDSGLFNWAYSDGQWLAAEFTIDSAHTITEVQTWIQSNYGGNGTASITLYSDGGEEPGVELHRAQYTISADGNGWFGASGLSWDVPVGTYWISFEVRPDDTLYVASIPSDAVTPLGNHATWDPLNGWRETDNLSLPIRIYGTPD